MKRSRINATLRERDSQKQESIDNVPCTLFSLSLCSLSTKNYEGLARSGCVNDQSWLARAWARTRTRFHDRAHAGGCHVRIYISDFLFMQLFVWELRVRVSRASRSALPSSGPPSDVVRRPRARTWRCAYAWGAPVFFIYTCSIGLSVFLV